MVQLQKHPIYWSDDLDTIIVHPKSSATVETLYRIHPSRIFSSKFLSESNPKIKPEDALEALHVDPDKCEYLVLDHIDERDFVVLLDHFYGHNVLSPNSSLSQISSILRITDSNLSDGLDIPEFHSIAKSYFTNLLPKDAQELATWQCEDSEAKQAMDVAVQLGILECQKPLLYYIATQTHLDSESESELDASQETSSNPSQSALISSRIHSLSTSLIAQFTPLLFTPPPTSHMECTDALAEHWMDLVITPAISDHAMGKPLQTLERMKRIEWGTYGLCESCTKDKVQEWTEEQEIVWGMLDRWVPVLEKGGKT